MLSGFPSKEQDYALSESEKRIGLWRAQVLCQLAPASNQLKEDPTLLRLTPANKLSFSPDGMSGGSAFVIQFIGDEPHANLAGIIMRAGTDSFYILRMGYAIAFIDSWIASDKV